MLALELLESELSRRERDDPARLPLLDFIPAVSTTHFAPEHLTRLCELLDRAIAGETVRVLLSLPPQHFKTDSLAHAIAKWLKRRPDHTLGYATYSQDQALEKSDLIKDLAVKAGVTLRKGRKGKRAWRTTSGGGLIACGVGGRLTGNNCKCVFLDDPYRNARDANSLAYRQFVMDWIGGVALTRATEALSLFLVHTRWHPDDAIGELAKRGGFEVINFPAVSDEAGAPVDDIMTGRPLLSLRATPTGDTVGFTLEGLKTRRALIGEYLWWALYMGAPRPRGGSVFRGTPPRYTEDPRVAASGRKIVVCLDAAGSESKKSNKSALVAMAVDESRPLPRAWALEVDSYQLEPQDSAVRVAAFVERWGGELLIEDTRDGRAVGKILATLAPSIRVTYVVPIGDKFMRAQLLAAAWNQGRLLLPLVAAWVDNLLRVFGLFRGVGDEEDDEVDAASHAFNHALANVVSGVILIDR